MKYLTILALMTLFFAPAANAQAPANADARVQILKGQIEGFLENQKAVALKNGCKLDTKGAIAVNKASGYYELTLPAVTYTDSEGIRSDIGAVTVNAVPDGEFDWKITMAIPSAISSFNAAGVEQFRTNIGSQNSTGVWNEKLGHFTSVNSTYSNVQFNNLVDQSTVTVGALSLSSAMTEKDPEAYTGSARATFDNISLFDSTTSFNGTIPKIVLDTNLADRAMKTPMTKEQVKNRAPSPHPDFYNVFSFLFGAPERVVAKVTGLDAINTQLQTAMITATPAVRAELLKGILAFNAISGMGKPVPGDASTKSYDVVFSQDGKVSINGTDFGSLVKTVAPAGNAQKPLLR